MSSNSSGTDDIIPLPIKDGRTFRNTAMFGECAYGNLSASWMYDDNLGNFRMNASVVKDR